MFRNTTERAKCFECGWVGNPYNITSDMPERELKNHKCKKKVIDAALFKPLSPKEEINFRQWAWDNYDNYDEVSPVWHPQVRQEWEIIDNVVRHIQNTYENCAPDMEHITNVEEAAKIISSILETSVGSNCGESPVLGTYLTIFRLKNPGLDFISKHLKDYF